jgi:hypothetical protein
VSLEAAIGTTTLMSMAGRSTRHGIPITTYQNGSSGVIKRFHVCFEKLAVHSRTHVFACLLTPIVILCVCVCVCVCVCECGLVHNFQPARAIMSSEKLRLLSNSHGDKFDSDRNNSKKSRQTDFNCLYIMPIKIILKENCLTSFYEIWLGWCSKSILE